MDENESNNSFIQRNPLLIHVAKILIVAIAMIAIEVCAIMHYYEIGNYILSMVFIFIFMATLAMTLKAIIFSGILIFLIALSKTET